jgi:hypothetical protein
MSIGRSGCRERNEIKEKGRVRDRSNSHLEGHRDQIRHRPFLKRLLIEGEGKKNDNIILGIVHIKQKMVHRSS